MGKLTIYRGPAKRHPNSEKNMHKVSTNPEIEPTKQTHKPGQLQEPNCREICLDKIQPEEAYPNRNKSLPSAKATGLSMQRKKKINITSKTTPPRLSYKETMGT